MQGTMHYALCKGAEVKMTVCHAPVSVVPDGLKLCKAQGSLFCRRGGNEQPGCGAAPCMTIL